MAPSAALQARISAFENLSSPKLTGGSRSDVPSPPQRQQHLLSRNTQEPHILDADPMSPTINSLVSIPPLTPLFNLPRSSSPPVLGRKTSLIDFSELSASPRLKKEPLLSSHESASASSSNSLLESLQKPQLPTSRLSPRIPPLPPRKLSQNSLKDSPPSKAGSLNLPVRSSPISITSAKLLGHSDSLLSLRDPMHHASNSSNDSSRHRPASSISSFQSVSLSSAGTGTTDSLEGSYEAVSSTVATSLVSTETPSSPVDALDSQTSKTSLKTLTLNNTTSLQSSESSSLTRRRPPPPPPPKPAALLRELSQPSPTISINSSLLKAVPIPMNFRTRYNAVFDHHVSLSQKGRSTSGWRGSSLDLLTGVDIDDLNDLQRSSRLDGYLVKSIWICSKLPKSRLRQIWAESDPGRTGSLDREGFALGMWRIDEALRVRRQSAGLSSLRKPPPSLPSRDPTLSYTYTPRVPHLKQKYFK